MASGHHHVARRHERELELHLVGGRLGAVTIKSRATDDSGNTETAGSGVGVTVNCPCGLFGANYVPYIQSDTDTGAYELGVKFQSGVAGWVAGVRFYKGTGNGGTHTGSLWSSSGTLLATGTFTNETATGWQTMVFPSAVRIGANTTYVVSYFESQGHYSVDEDLFDSARNVPPLTGMKSNFVSVPGGDNGIYNPGGPGFPTHSYHGWSYSVERGLRYGPAAEPPGRHQRHARCRLVEQPGLDRPHGDVLRGRGAQFGVVQADRLRGNAVSGTTSMNGTDTVATFTPASPLAAGAAYTVTISGARDNNGQTMLSSYSYTFITSHAFDAAGKCPCAIWPDVAPSNVNDVTDQSSGVELGRQVHGFEQRHHQRHQVLQSVG